MAMLIGVDVYGKEWEDEACLSRGRSRCSPSLHRRTFSCPPFVFGFCCQLACCHQSGWFSVGFYGRELFCCQLSCSRCGPFRLFPVAAPLFLLLCCRLLLSLLMPSAVFTTLCFTRQPPNVSPHSGRGVISLLHLSIGSPSTVQVLFIVAAWSFVRLLPTTRSYGRSCYYPASCFL
jgi:hypothetical protein